MENLILSFTVVFPLFAQLVLGYFLRRIGLFDDHTLQKCNKLIFKVFLPCLLFLNIYTSDISQVFNGKLIVCAALTVLVTFGALMVVVPIFEKDNKKRGVMVQGIYRSNFVLFGVPVTISLFGDGNIGTASIMMAVVVPLFNILSVVALETFRGGKPNGKKMAKGIVKNPLIIASALAVVFLLTGLKLPEILVKTATDISKVATPMSLLVLGGTFDFSKLRGNLLEMFVGIFGRLVLVPAIFLPIFAALGFRGMEMGAVLAMLASPTAVSSFPMAIEMDADGTLAGQIVVGTTMFCIFTIFFWIFFLKQMGWM
ncbi:MAG: AEC family transporter [Clostridiales bacterium]|nr:AEC family transporter [Clostridiales bacterium]